MASPNYDDPDLSSKHLTYKKGKPITDGLGFHQIRKYNIDNLEKEYNYLFPRCLDIYKRLKYSELNNNSDKSTLESEYMLCSNKLNTLKLKLEEANSVTAEQLAILKEKNNNEDQHIFINQQKINDSSNILNE